MDTHVHPQTKSPRDIEVTKAKSIVEIQQQLRAKAKELGPGEWITGFGWDEALLTEKRNLTSKDLDAAAPNNPVVLTRAGGHSDRRQFAGHEGSRHHAHDGRSEVGPHRALPDGEPNGVIRERSDLYRKLVPKDTWEQLKPSYVKRLKEFLSLGITSIESATGSLDDEPVGKGGVAEPGAVLTFKRFRRDGGGERHSAHLDVHQLSRR